MVNKEVLDRRLPSFLEAGAWHPGMAIHNAAVDGKRLAAIGKFDAGAVRGVGFHGVRAIG